jgi:hypothetical protein
MTLLSPTRFRVTKADLAAASADPARKAALEVMARPRHSVALMLLRAGETAASETTFFCGPADGPIVAQADDAGGAELALLPSAAIATVAIDELVGISDLAAVTGDVLELGLAGFAALLAAADASQSASLRARLAREVRSRPPLNAELLEAMLRDGLAAQDTRWAVTAAALVTPADLRSATGAMAAGIGELQQARLLEPAAGGYALTQDGSVVAATFGQLVTVARLTLVRPSGDVVPLPIFRAATAIWLALWTDARGARPRVTLVPATVAGALTQIRRMLEGGMEPAAAPAQARESAAAPPAAISACPKCGTEARPGAAFCGNCGTRLS